MSDEAVAQARRLYMHVKDGGSVTVMDMSRIVNSMEKMQSKLEWWNTQSREMYKALNDAEAECGRLKKTLRHLGAIAGTGVLHQSSLNHAGLVELLEEVRDVAHAALGETVHD